MLSMGGYTGADERTTKVDPLYYHWFSQFAANNVSAVLPVYAAIRKTTERITAVTEVAGMCKTAYKEQRMQRIEDEVLAKYGMTWEELKSGGRERLSDRDFQILTERIRGFDLDIELLISGFDEEWEPHIFTVCNPGTADYYDKLGFWAIGSGQSNALAALFSSRYKTEAPLEECISHVLSAKFAAESAQGVGQSTYILIYNDDDDVLLLPDSLENRIKSEWKKLPKIPTKNLPRLRGYIAIAEEDRAKRPKTQKSGDPQ